MFFSQVLLAQKLVFHDKDAEPRSVADFHAIEISSAIDLRLSSSHENAVAVSASNSDLRDAVKTEVVNGVLKISFSNKGILNFNKRARVYLAAKSLERLQATGACDIKIAGELKMPELVIDLSGATDLKGQVNVNTLKIKLSGSSDVEMKGSAENMSLDLSGASSFEGYDMAADYCKIKASGASEVEITVHKVISAIASGASDISYGGNAQQGEIRTSGASSVTRK